MATNVILGDLRVKDHFNIITFSSRLVSRKLEAPSRLPPRIPIAPRITWVTWKLMVVKC